jgi:transposase
MARYKVTLTEEERIVLLDICKRDKNAKKVKKALLLLNVDEQVGLEKQSDSVIAQTLKVNIKTVERIKKSFVEEGFDIALNGPPSHPRCPKKIDGQVEAHLLALTCSPAPEGRDRWTLRLLAEKMVELDYIDSISYQSVYQRLKKTKLSLGKRNVG